MPSQTPPGAEPLIPRQPSAEPTREEWLYLRRTGITGTDQAAILGISPYATRLDVYLDKLGMSAEKPESPAMIFGTRSEAVGARIYAEKRGVRLIQGAFTRHPENPLIIGTPDFLVEGQPRLTEHKAIGRWSRKDWGEPGTDGVPHHYLTQVFHYMALTGAELADVVALFHELEEDQLREIASFSDEDLEAFIRMGLRAGTMSLGIYPVAKDPEAEAMLLRAAVAFWENHVVPQIPPPPDGTERCTEYLARRYANSGGNRLQADDQICAWAAKLRIAQEAVKEAEHDEREARNNLMALIGEADGVDGPFGRINWVRPKPRATTDWQQVAKACQDQILSQHPEWKPLIDALVEKATSTKASTPYLKPLFTKESA